MATPRALMDLASLPSASRPQFLRQAMGLALLAANAAICAPQRPSPGPAGRGEDPTKLVIRADSQQKERDTYHLRGHVHVTYRTMEMTAEDATLDEATGDMTARGHVLFVDPHSHITADEVHYNLRNEKGWFANGVGYVHPPIHPRPRMLTTENPFYFQAQRVNRLDEETYVLEHGHMSTCKCEKKGWAVYARRARVQVDDKLVTQGADVRMLGVPVFYSPFMVNSIAPRERQTGFLLPHIGTSSQKGFIVGDGFFWAINPSTDLLLGFEDYSSRGPASRGEFRARPSEDSDFDLNYFAVDDRGIGPNRQTKASGESIQVQAKDRDLFWGFRGVVGVDYINSLAFRLTWADTFAQAVSSEVHQSGFLTKSFDAYSLNFYVTRYQNFFSATQGPADSVVIRQTPSVSFSGVDKQVGHSPFFFSLDASAGGMARDEPFTTTTGTIMEHAVANFTERLDFFPQITLRSKPFWGFHLTPTVSARATRYGTSFKNEPLNRLLGEFTLDLRPPSLEKVFAKTYMGRRVKHVIEPDIQYRLIRVRDPENVMDVVRFDQLDIFAQTNEVEYSLTNSLLARKDVPEGTTEIPQAKEVFSLRISEKYYFDPTFGGAVQPGSQSVIEPTISLTGFAFTEGKRLSPVVSVAKFAPFSNYDTELRADFSPNGGGVLNAGITSHVHRGPLGLALTDFFINKTAALPTPITPAVPASLLPSFHLLRTVVTYGDVNRKGFSGAAGVDYNFALKEANQVVSQLSYNFGCFGLDFEYRRFSLGPLRRENQYRVALSLANVGTFGNLKRRERLY